MQYTLSVCVYNTWNVIFTDIIMLIGWFDASYTEVVICGPCSKITSYDKFLSKQHEQQLSVFAGNSPGYEVRGPIVGRWDSVLVALSERD